MVHLDIEMLEFVLDGTVCYRAVEATYKIVWQSPALPPKPSCHLGEPLRLNEVVEGKGREHGPIAMDFCFDEQRGAANAVQLYFLGRIGFPFLHHVGHKSSVCSHATVALEENLVRPQFLRHVPRRLRVDPIIEVVRPHRHSLLVLVEVALEAVRRDDRLVMGGQVLDEARRRLDNVGVEPEHPAGGGAHGGEEQAVAGLCHGRAPRLLVLELVPLVLRLRLQRRLRVLPQDRDAGEPLLLRARLRLLYLLLQSRGGCVALPAFGQDESEGDEFVGIGEF